MTNEQLIIVAKTALILKGKWGTWDEEAIWLNKMFSDLEIGTCTFIVQKLAVSGKIKLKTFISSGLYSQLNQGYKHSYYIDNFKLEDLQETFK